MLAAEGIVNKPLRVCLVLLLVCAAAHAEDPSTKKVLIPMRIPFQEAWFVDATGAAVDRNRYADAGDYTEGLAAVRVPSKGWGFVDAGGRFAVQPQFRDVHPFQEGLAAVQQEKDELWGYVDAAGKPVIPARYKLAYSFQEGFAHVWDGKESFLIDKSGRALSIPAPWRLSGLEGFSEGLAPVCTGEIQTRAGFVDASGKIALVLQGCSEAREFHEGLAAAKIDGKWGYVDKAGKVAIPAAYDLARGFSGKRAAVQIGKKWGFIDPQGKIAVDAAWDGCGDFSGGLAAVAAGGAGPFESGTWSYIDADGKTAITPGYSFAGAFRDGFAEVAVGDILRQEYFYIDRKGRPLPGLSGFLVDAKTDFSTDRNAFGLVSDGRWKLEKGAYSFASKEGLSEWICGGGLAPSDFIAEVKVVSMAGDEPAAGLVFRLAADGRSLYWFGIRKDGSCTAQYSVKSKDGADAWTVLGTSNLKARTGTNTLQVVCRGETVFCFLNGAKAITFRDSRIGASYGRVGLLASSATAASFDDLAVRAIGRDEAIPDLDLTPTLEDLGMRLDAQLAAFPDSELRLFIPPPSPSAGELFLSFGGLGDGAYLMGRPDPLEFSFVGQPLWKDVGRYAIQFPAVMPKLAAGATMGADAPTNYAPRLYHPLLSLYGGLSEADLAAALKASPHAAGIMDLAVFLRDWKALAVDWTAAEQRIRSENRFVLGEDPFGIVMDAVGIGGILAALVGLIDWGIVGTFGERQSWEVWGGLAALGSYYAVYMPIAYFIIDPIYEGIAKGKVEEEKRKWDEKFRARAAAFKAKYPEDVVEGRPKGTETK